MKLGPVYKEVGGVSHPEHSSANVDVGSSGLSAEVTHGIMMTSGSCHQQSLDHVVDRLERLARVFLGVHGEQRPEFRMRLSNGNTITSS